MNSRPSLSAIVLAAGVGTRMRSNTPKPLHKLCGKALVMHVVDAIAELSPERMAVVVGHHSSQVRQRLVDGLPAKLQVDFVDQQVQRGTADATLVGLEALADSFGSFEDDEAIADVIVTAGDMPLLRTKTLAALLAAHRDSDSAATVLTARMSDPSGYGRVLRAKDGRVQKIVEEKEASPDQVEIDEVNTGIYIFRRAVLGPALRRVTPDNAAGELYLTDVIEVLSSAGYWVSSMQLTDPTDAMGVNDRTQLAAAEKVMRGRINDRWLHHGVTLMDPLNTYIDATVRLDPDVTLYPGCWLQGNTVVSSGCRIGPNTRIIDSAIGDDSIIENSVIRQSTISPGSVVGPFQTIGELNATMNEEVE